MTRNHPHISRRTALRTVAGAALVSVAGCLNDNGGSRTPGDGTTSPDGNGPLTRIAVEGTTLVVELSEEADVDQVNLIQPNGEKFERLWNGNTVGYDSQSEADMALCCLLAFWIGGDRAQMEQLFHQSRLMREKWDEVRYADGSTYGEKTIERAIATTSEFYIPTVHLTGSQLAGRLTT